MEAGCDEDDDRIVMVELHGAIRPLFMKGQALPLEFVK